MSESSYMKAKHRAEELEGECEILAARAARAEAALQRIINANSLSEAVAIAGTALSRIEDMPDEEGA